MLISKIKRSTKLQPYKSNGLYLHASSVNIDGKALLFLGHSTSGKSTISRLLSIQYPIIADDKVWIHRKNNKGWMVCNGGDFLVSGRLSTYPVDKGKKYPLLAVLRIFKSNIIDLKEIYPIKACRYILDAIFEIDIQRRQNDLDVKKKWFSLAAEISKETQGWELTFNRDKSIIDLIHGKFGRTPVKINLKRRN